ncbi:cell envelope integrity EipB family protein [Enterovirga aerilata]|uniref:Cell envelope integrity EipB family protein n=1 Tax=Enterovirga aerilata TaxID=2730920 RepID=A0A849I3B7_9HYPH|nr:cell envelope integrity EipB family protein [Enterovirga sp. DB1703]NNM72134.1 cell envelope integrity EipB family protein [Enterovirga sp. DB1703]
MRFSVVLGSTALLLALPAQAQVAAEKPPHLAPHRVVYDLSLASSRGARTIESARGRIAFDFTGDACEGYALKFRQVTVMQSAEAGTKTSDLRTANFESGDGRTFRFRNDTGSGEGPGQSVDGSAERKPNGPLSVRLKSPKRDNVSLDGDAVFPNTQMRDLIAAARAGKTTLAMKIFDGSDDGRTVYETLSVIGKRIEPGNLEGLEEPARQEGLAKLARWPVTMSYFKPGRSDQTPIYVLSFDLYENGVSRALRLDYGDFALKGEMTRLELLPEKPCQR